MRPLGYAYPGSNIPGWNQSAGLVDDLRAGPSGGSRFLSDRLADRQAGHLGALPQKGHVVQGYARVELDNRGRHGCLGDCHDGGAATVPDAVVVTGPAGHR